MAFEKVLNRLKLAEGSGETAVLEAIADRDNQLFAANKQIETLTGRERAANESKEKMEQLLKEAQNTVNEMTGMFNKEKEARVDAETKFEATNKELTSLKVDNEELKVDRREKEAANNKLIEDGKKERASNLIEKYKAKLPENEVVLNKWREKAFENYDDAEMLLETMAVNRSVPHPDDRGANDLIKEGESALAKVYGKGSDADFRAANKLERQRLAKVWGQEKVK